MTALLTHFTFRKKAPGPSSLIELIIQRKINHLVGLTLTIWTDTILASKRLEDKISILGNMLNSMIKLCVFYRSFDQ